MCLFNNEIVGEAKEVAPFDYNPVYCVINKAPACVGSETQSSMLIILLAELLTTRQLMEEVGNKPHPRTHAYARAPL